MISDLVKAGYMKYIGLAEVDAETFKKMNDVHPINLIETEYSLFNRSMKKGSILYQK